MMRQICKEILTIMAWLVVALPALAQPIASKIVVDPLTGVAIDGFDAVSYFIEAQPLPGKPEHEYVWQGVPWYFASAANRDIFARNPDFYAPQYGGHCVMSLGRGYLSDGKPRLYLVDGLKLYFFYSTANREAFLMSRSAALTAADASWAALTAPPVSEPPSAEAAAH
jgi:YHS domain-containing protein